MATGIASPCPSCGETTLEGTATCPRCGAVSASETLEQPVDSVVPNPGFAASQAEPRPTVHQVHRRPLGVHPVPLLGGIAAVALLGAVLLLASGSLLGGLVLIVLGVAFLVLFVSACRREPDLPIARLVLRVLDRFRSLCGLAGVSLRAWALTALNLLLIALRRRRLRSELEKQLKPLGEAVYKDDQRSAEALKQRAVELERELDGIKREASAVIEAARREIHRERATVEPTQTHTPGQKDEGRPGGV